MFILCLVYACAHLMGLLTKLACTQCSCLFCKILTFWQQAWKSKTDGAELYWTPYILFSRLSHSSSNSTLWNIKWNVQSHYQMYLWLETTFFKKDKLAKKSWKYSKADKTVDTHQGYKTFSTNPTFDQHVLKWIASEKRVLDPTLPGEWGHSNRCQRT